MFSLVNINKYRHSKGRFLESQLTFLGEMNLKKLFFSFL